MTSGAVAVTGTRLLGKLAAPAATKLANKVFFRIRVRSRVAKKVDFKVPGRPYRAWLKGLGVSELSTPVEQIASQLAVRLDARLCTDYRPWKVRPDHLSRALTLVELTYPAIAAALGDADRTELSEAWAQTRNAQVREVLVQLVGPGGALSSADVASALRRRSEARRAVRLQAFGLSERDLEGYFSRVAVLNVPAGEVRVIEGDFGSGKSELAETWHRDAVDAFAISPDVPLPVWLRARELGVESLERAIEHRAGPGWRQGSGTCVVLDGLDEAEVATASALLDAARVLTRTHPTIRVLVTARPGILALTDDERIAVPLLGRDESLALVAQICGNSSATWKWTEEMRATVRRPFFALAAGEMLKRDEAALGEADLIRSLVEHALRRASDREVVTTADTREALTKTAVSLTSTGEDGLSFAERQIVRSSTLVEDGASDGVLFALPIFQHWFAAQALLEGQVDPAVVVANRVSFGRWRWAAAIAALSAPDEDRLDDLLGMWIARNPGAAAWIIKEAFSGHRDWRTAEDEHLDAATSGTRLVKALRAWTNGLGPLAAGVLPYPVVQGPVQIGVTVSGHRVDVAFSTSPASADCVVEVPPGVHPLLPTEPKGWRPWISGGVPQGHAWPWTMVRNQIARATLGKLAHDPFLGAPDGIWVQERRFDLARRLVGRGSLLHGAIPAADVRTRATHALEAVGRNLEAQIQFPASATYTALEVGELIAWIDTENLTDVESGLPDRDVLRPTGGWIWDAYSPRRLMEFEAEVYGRACEAYDEAMAHSFDRVGWSMPSSALSPFGVVLEIEFNSGSRLGNMPGLTVMRVPMAMLEQIARPRSESFWSVGGRSVITAIEDGPKRGWERHSSMLDEIRSWLAKMNVEPIDALGWSSTGANDMSEVRPACSVAARWLWDDLKAIGLGEGTFPQLR